MPVINQAAAMLAALASPDRLRLLSAVTTLDGSTVGVLAETLDIPIKTLVKEVGRLQDCGLLTVTGHTVTANLPALRETAAALTGDLPIAALLRTQPDLERYFVHGRLTDLTVDHSAKLRLAPLLARLLPDDRAVPEKEVNELLNQVHDDHAYLRRMLVDFGQVIRDESACYRRAG